MIDRQGSAALIDNRIIPLNPHRSGSRRCNGSARNQR
jgi:hypothetical protein